ncbi:hypothetical protein A3K34_02970 [candidate division WWE3 bacterium RIFOXYC1_FULL_40_10]|uniref:Glycosyl transferase family 1 domain-containing protein n=1 Tax=candidate division WWE3 bacterium RIFOXYA2_FULL_46_9 TaxID=1802636 RepID=A0A1F4W060_UNCKA|nr:MAG: hypothetical protein A3K58_02970 [candidate division WWE3 bacterium RIFOXYB1_FULL_40_22]OGC61809.1 MAG: hypothetical protein A3K37_02970 [candidate division WWE3 bacterium RIFOXYA1_FULL_40_11]OGC62827.1 MAG: hypothetical protein A2264_04130 [candidate division WWE3 bacterium RIFOXYA2_FULL_46_9]OGC64281.1 MAG: hypothetical protein A2326_00385 [candidate division WWE3 bacterium RIFOXYB2_FULL_41_6]OGC66192.1 MAG: hypothetical protein A3K34_02970 [candidate division WWE3 bacterium RIFOXYC1_
MQVESEKFNIICLSNQLWNYPLWTNKKHVMYRAGKLGHKVLFVDPPINTGRVFWRQLKRGEWPLRRLLSKVFKDEDAWVFSPLNCLPLKSYLARHHSTKINKLCQKFMDKNLRTVLWIYHVEIPGLENYLRNIDYDILIYDCVDNYAGFSRYNTPQKKEAINKVEKELAQKADIVFATAPVLFEKLKKFNENTYYTPNVGDYAKFSKLRELQTAIPEKLSSIPTPRIGYSGALEDYKLDVQLISKLAASYPNYSFVILGGLGLKDREASPEALGFEPLPNLHFMGVVPYKIVETYFAGFDAYIIPYVLNDYTVGGCFPVKFHDALAAGLPVIVTNLPAYKPFEKVAYISKNEVEFIENVKKAIEENSPEKVEERLKVAKENSWDNKVGNMFRIIREYKKK